MMAPKQMRHWMEANGFRLLRYKKRNWRECPIAITRKPRFCEETVEPHRLIRVLPHLGLMQICDGNFDRWANSVGAEIEMPKTKAQFETALGLLIEEAVPNVRRQAA